MITLLAYAASAGLLSGLIHLLIALIVIAIVYFIGKAIAERLGADPIILTLWLALCGLIALGFVIAFLLSIAP